MVEIQRALHLLDSPRKQRDYCRQLTEDKVQHPQDVASVTSLKV